MAELNESTAKRVAKLIRLMSSEHDGEWGNAVRKLKLVLNNEGLTFNDLAIVIENCDGAIEERKYSDDDAKIIFARGVEKGRVEEAQKQQAPPEFYEADGTPRWYEIALFLHNNKARLRKDWDKGFVEELPSRIAGYGTPTRPMIKQIFRIFIMLGGTVDPKILQNYA
jgi:hypothetical protein